MERRELLLLFGGILLLNSCEDSGGNVPPYTRKKSTGSVKVNSTIVVTGTFDGKNKRYYASSSNLGDGSQSEGQKPIFRLKPGARLKNVIIDHPGADGVHVEASDGKTTRIEDCEWWDVGEDAITVRSGDNDAKVSIKNCYFDKAADKVIQINSNPIVTIEDCYAENFKRFVRTNGTAGAPNLSYRVTIKNCFGKNGITMLRMSNSKARGTITNVVTNNVSDLYQVSGGAKVST